MSLSSTYLSRKKLIADNLQSMGVLTADETDGLTTLANKILDIEPSISGLDLDTSLVLHSSDDTCLIGQSIMFWAECKADYDDETATDVDLSGVLTGATVEFKNGNTVLGTAVTDSDGIAYYTHTFATAGVYDISASFNGTENFDDCVSNSISVSVTYRLVITADKPILSYNDHEYATISATLSDGAGGVSGETLSYEILDKEDNVLDSGSDVTDALGEISFTYQSAGVGDVQVIVYYGMFLQEIYAIEDCDRYDDATSDKTSNYGSIIAYRSGGSGQLNYNSTNGYYGTISGNNEAMVTLSELTGQDDFTVEYDALFNANVNNIYGISGICAYENNDNYSRISCHSQKTAQRVTVNGSASENETNLENNINRYDLVHFKFTISNNQIIEEVTKGTTHIGTRTISYTPTNATKFGIAFVWSDGWTRNTYLKNIKVKAL